MKKFTVTLFFISVFSLLQGCAGGLIVVAGTAVAVTSDERTLSQQLDDSALSTAALDKINELNIRNENIRINLISNSGYLLVVGQVTDQQTKDQVEQQLKTLKQAKGVYNQLRIAKPIGFSQQSKDSWITTKVKSQLTGHEEVNSLKIKVITENAEVFLIGIVSEEMANNATNITRKVDGVKQVNRVFQLIK
ncbi:BON domain-containing protein [Psychromonas antarctica]|uniref:BON domain-containing protein n=1 Tax=Psychromonas antarctica TaxID=67573 RepID=UPI001EE99397|nr:BON domain-containing protein [Psychromonas antarctica]MCG6199790.1 BON domain-containing protein [Psychromonas antarctica]